MYCSNSLFFLVLFIAAMMETSRGHNYHGGDKIVGGKPAEIQKHPYEVFLLFKQTGTNKSFRCAGSIATEHCIITAGHCLLHKESVNIRVGSAEAMNGGTTYSSRMFMTHPEFNFTTDDYDIGVIKVMKSIEIDDKNSALIEFPKSNCSLPAGTNVTVAGWGDTSLSGNKTDKLMEVSLGIIPNNECNESYPILTSRMICAGSPKGGKSPCKGDAGDPLVKTGTKIQVGLASHGIGCGSPKYPSIYTNLCNPKIQQWLKSEGCM